MDILHTTQLTQQKWLNLFRREFRHQDQTGAWIFASRHSRPEIPPRKVDAVLIVPLLLADGHEPRLVVTREYRVPLGCYEVGFPAGLVEEGETIASTTRRELREETGLEVAEILLVSPITYSSAGMTDEGVVMVFVTATAPPHHRQALEGSEVIEVQWLNHREVCALCAGGEPINGRTWPVLLMFQQLGRLHFQPLSSATNPAGACPGSGQLQR
jgi:ADP-ribose pyrophosphatase